MGNNEAVAVHEAGHAVAALLATPGTRVPSLVTVDPEVIARHVPAGPEGLTRFRTLRAGWNRLWARRGARAFDALAVIDAGGVVAEGLLRGVQPADLATLDRMLVEGGGQGDADNLADLFEARARHRARPAASSAAYTTRERRGATTLERRFGSWRLSGLARTAHLLAAPRARHAVEALAAELRRRGTISGARAIRAVAGL